MLYSYACSYKARVEARVKGDAEYIPNKLQFSSTVATVEMYYRYGEKTSAACVSHRGFSADFYSYPRYRFTKMYCTNGTNCGMRTRNLNYEYYSI